MNSRHSASIKADSICDRARPVSSSASSIEKRKKPAMFDRGQVMQ
jgi:hypothetical protein